MADRARNLRATSPSGNGVSIRVAVALGSALALFPLAALGVYFASHHNAPASSSDLYVAVENSVAASVAALVIVAVLGIPLGFYLFLSRSAISKTLAVLVRLPLGVPPLVAGVMLLVAFGPNSPVGHFFGGRLTNTFIAIVIAQSFASLPYVVEGARGAFASVDPRARVVATSLKMTPLAEMVAIFIPLGWTSIRSSLTLGYLRAFGEFGAVLLVAYSPFSLPIYTYVSFEGSGLAATVAPIAITLLLSGAFALGLSNLAWPTTEVLKLLRKAGATKSGVPPRPRGVANIGDCRVKVQANLGAFVLDVDFVARPGCTVLLGPSGAGKTLTLNALCDYLVDDETIQVEGAIAEIRRSAIGYVPQRFGLWPHMTLQDNLELASSLSRSGLAASELLSQLELGEFADRLPSSLSGGQYQRGALARAMATNSSMAILDEPLSALDVQLRAAHQRLIYQVVKPAVEYLFVVTHDVAEAAYLADWLVIIEAGKVLQQGAVGEVLGAPVNSDVARIIGADNLVRFPEASEIPARVRGKLACFFSEDIAIIPEGSAKMWHGVVPIGNFVLEFAKEAPWSWELRFSSSDVDVIARRAKNPGEDFLKGSTYELGLPERRLFLFDA